MLAGVGIAGLVGVVAVVLATGASVGSAAAASSSAVAATGSPSSGTTSSGNASSGTTSSGSARSGVLPGAESTATPSPGNDQSQITPTQPPSTQPPSTQPPPTATPVAPTIADPGDITSGTARLRGTGTPGDTVRVADPAVPSASVCSAPVDADGGWACSGDVRTGPRQVFTVFDTTTSALDPDDSPAVDVVVPPVIAASGPTTGSVSGTGYAGATIAVTASNGTTRTSTVGTDGHWVVSFGSGDDALPTGPWTLTATQTAGTALGFRSDLRSSASAPRSVTIDRTAPAAPVIVSPTAGSRIRTQPVTIVGTGEDGAVATVYIDNNPVCQAVVANGSWTCSTAGESIPDGTRTLVAGQRDAAGNFSPVTSARSVTVAGAPANTTPTGSPSGRASSAPSGQSSASGSGGAGGSSGPGTTSPNGAAPGGGPDGTVADAGSTGWAVATAYDGAVPTIQSAVSLRTLLLVLGGIVGFLALVAVPLKLVARSVRGRVVWRRARLTGRNRTAVERSDGDDTGLPAWATIALSIGIASVLMLLGTGIEAQARYARLSIAVVLGTTVLALGVVLATRWAAGSAREGLTYRLSPVLLVGALVACALTRSADLSPALLLGVLVVPSGRPAPGPPTSDTAARGRSATWRTGTLLVLVAIGWGLHSVISTGSGTRGFWGELVGEFAITLCVGGLGSVVTTLLPIAGTAGAALWSTSRARYAAIASIGIALAVAVYSGAEGTHLSAVAVGTAVGGCAVVGLVTWTWVRVVEPVLRC